MFVAAIFSLLYSSFSERWPLDPGKRAAGSSIDRPSITGPEGRVLGGFS
jgi:hypothetical protein